jgi:adenosylhomocysteinase
MKYTREREEKHKLFFDLIEEKFSLGEYKDVDIVAVLHLLPDFIPFSYFLKKKFNLKYIIPKPRSIDKNILNRAKKDNKIIFLNRDEIEKGIFKILDKKRKTIFLDIGGYFAKSFYKIEEFLGDNFLGIVEDTENGIQKYISLVKEKDLKKKVISVARSELKENEDYLVGQSIIYSLETTLRSISEILSNKKLGVIGVGKIGFGVADNYKLGKVIVYDINPIRLSKVYSKGFEIANSKYEILEKSDLICLATGNKSLKNNDFKKIKNDAFVFSVTSSDDELNLDFLKENYKKIKINNRIDKYIGKKNRFYLINDGNTINFLDGTTVGDYILFVHSEIILGIYALLGKIKRNIFLEVDDEYKKEIATTWLSLFSKQEKGKEIKKDILKNLKYLNSENNFE